MAEFASAEGGHSEGKKGKMSKNQKMLFFGGGLAVIGFFLVMSRGGGGGSSSGEEEIPDYLTNYPELGPQNALMNDQMNTLIGHQEEMLNSLLEATGKKEPDTINKIQTIYSDEAGALKAQNWLIQQGVNTTNVRKKYDEKGWAGAGYYYVVEGFSHDMDELAEVSAKGKTDKIWQAINSKTVNTKDAPKYGQHGRQDWFIDKK